MNHHVALVVREIIDCLSSPCYSDECKKLRAERQKADNYWSKKSAIDFDIFKRTLTILTRPEKQLTTLEKRQMPPQV